MNLASKARTRWLRTGSAGLLAAVLLMPGARPAPFAFADNRDEPSQKEQDRRRARDNQGVSPDRVIVIYDSDLPTEHERRQEARRLAGGTAIHKSAELRRDVLRVPNGNAEDVARALRTLPDVRDAYPDQIVHHTAVSNDPRVVDEWGLVKVQAPVAWSASTGEGVTVAVLDCGIRAGHPDLAGKVVRDFNATDAPSTDDRCNHGTHAAGTIGAVTNNGIGVASVAPGVKLLNAKVLADDGSGFLSDVDLAIRWAADNGARVISMSLGANLACPAGTQVAADYAWGRGAVLVAATGNSGLNQAGTPANCRNVIGVAATDQNDARASFSNAGPETDVAAPGVQILSTVNPDLNGGSAYAYFSGTSMATPHVAGLLAMIWSSDYGTGPAAVRDRLFSTADRISGTGSSWTHGRINAARALAVSASQPAATATATPRATATLQPTATATRPAPTATAVKPTATAVKPAPTATPVQTVVAPRLLVAKSAPGKVTLTWKASTTPGATYNIYRGTGRNNKVLYARGASGLSYVDTNVKKGQRYYYHVTANAAGRESGRSNETSIVAR